MTQRDLHPPSMFVYLAVATTVLAGPAAATAQQQSAGGASPEEVARRVLRETPLFDGHNDLPWAIRGETGAPGDVAAYPLEGDAPGHTDIPRLREGMVGAQFWSVYVPPAMADSGWASRVQLEEIDIARRIFHRYPGSFGQAFSASDVERIFGQGRVASVLGLEGGHVIENSMGALRAYYDLGARYMTLTHFRNTEWADAATDEPEHGGLTAFGEEVVREMNRLGMLVDLSHVSAETMRDALDVTAAPVIFSHSSARAVVDHPRNVPDDVLRRLPENGGVVMVTFVPSYISPEIHAYEQRSEEYRENNPAPRATIDDVVAHIEHVREVAGIDHVGIGSDFDGISSTPVGLEDVSDFPALFEELARRGWTEEELAKLAGGNVLRAWKEAEAVARRLQRTRDPSMATLEQESEGGGQE